MRIGIIGTGNIGGTLAELLEGTDHEVMTANSTGGVAEAAEFGELVFVAIPFVARETLPAEELGGKIVVDAMNYYPGRDGQIEELDRDETTSSEMLAQHLEGDARVVKAFNTMEAPALAEDGRPAGAHDRLVLFVASDDEHAKRTVVDLIDELGFDAIDTGTLADGGRLQQPGSPAYGALVTAVEAPELLG